MLAVLHSGQTGVERGAHRAAIAAGLHVAGFCSSELRDEMGLIPADVLAKLQPCSERGPRQAIKANLMEASAAMIVVPRLLDVRSVAGIAEAQTLIRARRLPMIVCDPLTIGDEVIAWAKGVLAVHGRARIMITGPRATRWQEGEVVARRLVTALASARGE